MDLRVGILQFPLVLNTNDRFFFSQFVAVKFLHVLVLVKNAVRSGNSRVKSGKVLLALVSGVNTELLYSNII